MQITPERYLIFRVRPIKLHAIPVTECRLPSFAYKCPSGLCQLLLIEDGHIVHRSSSNEIVEARVWPILLATGIFLCSRIDRNIICSGDDLCGTAWVGDGFLNIGCGRNYFCRFPGSICSHVALL